ncbi:MAG: FHA domain-containing protein [Deltaproteobacteria bacterium]|jgi:pSer/pThr/pTyr-binding forkhead associated (FHA) protein|nr:FHA domain-containing protein [Deltaproteobacteria bacterium]MBT6435776.1 FHA domain-containing protein [Deltaproteobacteria bacterium]MBT6488823.1 FHA domain-containing protein [Deltaproteobacteria bacterium]
MDGVKTGAFEESTVFGQIDIKGPEVEVSVMKLEEVTKDDSGRLILLERDLYTLGRSAKADITLESSELSRKHVLLKREHGSFSVTDLDSTNGVYLNGTKVYGAQLYHGDLIQLGDLVFRFREWGP